MVKVYSPSPDKKFAASTTIHRQYRIWLEQALERHPRTSRSELLRRAIEGDGLVAEIAKLDADEALAD